MSVPKSHRSKSDLEFFHNAIVLRREITNLLLRDFGLKAKARTVDMTAKMYELTEEDKAYLNYIEEKYGMRSIMYEYPSWLIDEFRNSILSALRSLMFNIRSANSIYVTSEAEYYERRNGWNRAIGNCEQLLGEMQYVIETIDVDSQKYVRYVEMIEREIALLKGIRKADNKILERIKNG